MILTRTMLLLAIAVAAVCIDARPVVAKTAAAVKDELSDIKRDIGDVAAQELEQATGTGDHKSHSEAGGDPLEFKTDLAIWTAVVFLLLLAFLWYFAWGPIRDGLDRREQGIADEIAQAAEAKRKADQVLREYEEKLSGGEDEVRLMFEKARRDAEEVGRRLVEKAKTDALAQRDRGIREIEAAKSGALQELARQSADMAVSLAGRIVGAELKPSDHTRLVKEAVDGFSPKSDQA